MQVGQRREGERKVSNFGKSLPSPDFSSCYVENCREGRREEVGHRALFPLVHQPSPSFLPRTPSPRRTRNPADRNTELLLN